MPDLLSIWTVQIWIQDGIYQGVNLGCDRVMVLEMVSFVTCMPR